MGDPVAAANSPEVIEFDRPSIERWVTAEEIEGGRQAAFAQFVPGSAQ